MNITFPLSGYVNTRDDYIIHEIDAQDKDIYNKKNTLVYQGVLSPLYIKSENKVFTTSGNTVEVSNSAVGDTPIDNSLTVTRTIDISKLYNGECLRAYAYGDKVYSSWKKGKNGALIISDFDNTIITLTKLEAGSDDEYYYGFYYNADSWVKIRKKNNSAHDLYFYLSDGFSSSATNQDVGSDWYVYYNPYTVEEEGETVQRYSLYLGADDLDIRKRCSYQIFDDGHAHSLSILYKGFGCIGQNGLITGEPMPANVVWTDVEAYKVSSNNIPTVTLDWSRATELDNGIVAFDTAAATATTVQDWLDSNADLANDAAYVSNGGDAMDWGGLDHETHGHRIVAGFWITGADSEVPDKKVPLLIDNDIQKGANDYKTFRMFSIDDNYFLHGYRVSGQVRTITQVDFSDGFGTLTGTGSITDGINPFPYRYFITNRQSSRGVYWDYGPGWVKSYCRKIWFESLDDGNSGWLKAMTERTPASIISYGLEGADNYSVYVRIEPLSPYTTVDDTVSYDKSESYADAYRNIGQYPDLTAYKRRVHTFNPTILDTYPTWVDFVGADNMPNHAVLERIPFNVSYFNDMVLDQYYNGNYMSTSRNGTLVFGASVNTDKPSYITNNSIYSNGQLVIFQNNGDVKLEKIADYLYKSNCVNGDNFFIDKKSYLESERSFRAYNGAEVLYLDELKGFSLPLDNENVDGNDTYYSASGYNVNITDNMNTRSSSYLLPAFQLPLAVKSEEIENFRFQLITNKKCLTKPLLCNFFTAGEQIDHYYTDAQTSTSVTYQESRQVSPSPDTPFQDRFGISVYDKNKEGMVWWINNEIQIFPLGIANIISGQNYLTSSVDFADNYFVRLYRRENSTFPFYNPNTEVYRSQTIFTIYGYNYSFDGQSIYYLGSGDDTSQSNFTCYAIGLRFLANSGTEAYFWSSFEKRIYLFTGSVTLQASDLLSREGNIIDSLFSSHEQALYILFDDGKLLVKTQNDMGIIENINMTENWHLESSDTGAILAGDNKYYKARLYQTDETEWLPIDLETEYIGKNDSLYKVSAIELTLYHNPCKGKLEYECVNDTLKKNETIPFTVSAKDYDDTELVKLRLTPKNNIGKAFRFEVSSEDYMRLANLNVVIDEVSENTNAAKHV